MDQPLNTIGYFIAGYGIIFGTILIYVVSLFVRWRNLKQDQELFSDQDES